MFDMNLFYQGLSLIVEPGNIGWLMLGFIMGVTFGIIPGFSEGTFLALITPFTLYMDPWSALIFMTAAYVAAEAAGSFPSILLNMPGTAGTFASAFEGYPLTQKGMPGQALGASMAASAVGGISGAIAFMFLGPLIGVYSLKFNSPEMFLVAVFGLTAVASVTGESLARGLASATMGLLIATTGADLIVGQARATFGFLELNEGVPLLPVLIGLFGFAELLRQVDQEYGSDVATHLRLSATLAGMREAIRHWRTVLRSITIGLIIGVIPGTGAATATVVSYGQARRWSKQPDEYGNGSFEGLVSTDSSNNACVPGALIPTLALGVPGSGSSAVMLTVLMLHGLRPGPGFWQLFPSEVYAIGFTCLVSAVLILACVFMVRSVTRIACAPARIVTPFVATFCIIGIFSYRGLVFDISLMVTFGLLGFVLKKFHYSVPALLLGIILGPIAEENFFRALQLGGPLMFVSSPLCLGLLACSAGSLSLPSVVRAIRMIAPKVGGGRTK